MGRRKKRKFKITTNKEIKKRPAIALICVSLVLTLLLVKIFLIAYNNKQITALRILKQENYASVQIPYKRGRITDINSVPLAFSNKKYNIILDVKNLLNMHAVNETRLDIDSKYKLFDNIFINTTIETLNIAFNISPKELGDIIEDNKDKSYVVLLKDVDEDKKLIFDKLLKEDINVKKGQTEKYTQKTRGSYVKGVYFEEKYNRYYPFGKLACDIIGFENYEHVGVKGIEAYYNDILSGVNGRKFKYVNDDHQLIEKIVEPKDGNNVELSIDLYYQEIIEKHMNRFNKKHRNEARKGDGSKHIGIILMDPNTGAIKAMASSPNYDLNEPTNLVKLGYKKSQINKMSEKEKSDILNNVWNNFCIRDPFEPGSTVKAEVLAYAINSGAINPNNYSYYCKGFIPVGGFHIHCARRSGHGYENAMSSLKHSCNTSFMNIGFKMGTDGMERCQSLFNFGKLTGIDLPGEVSGSNLIHKAADMSITDLATNAFGQNFNVTMIQMATAFSSVINGGYYYRPYFMNRIIDKNGIVIDENRVAPIKQVISEKTSRLMRDYLYHTVQDNDATGQKAKMKDYKVGGKTGTAQKIPRGNGKYLISFIGFIGLKHPELVGYVVIDEPNVPDQSRSALSVELWRDIMMDITEMNKITKNQ